MSWKPKYKFFKLVPECHVNYGHEWEIYKLNSVFECINKIVKEDKTYFEKYGHIPEYDIPKDVKFNHAYKSERFVIELGRELNGPLFKTWRTLYPDRFSLIKKLYKKLRLQSMQYTLGCCHYKAETIGYIINEPTRDMYYIMNKKYSK